MLLDGSPQLDAAPVGTLHRVGEPSTRQSRIEEFKAVRAAALKTHGNGPFHFDIGLKKVLSMNVEHRGLLTDLEQRGSRIGMDWAGSHVGEFLQGVETLPGLPSYLQDPRLPRPDAVRFLMDLPCDAIFSSATVIVTTGTGKITTAPAGLNKAAFAAEAMLAFLDLETVVDVHIKLETNIRKGRGLGSSSADVRAVLKALGNTLHVALDDDMIDKLTVFAEGAANPAGRAPSLFCHRLGFAMARLNRWPQLTVLAFDDRAAADIDTDLHRPADYDADQLKRFSLLTRAALAAITAGDARGLGIVASTSADINDCFLPRRLGSSLENMRCIARKTEAAGYAVSHSGTVGAMLYATSSTDLPRRLQRAADQLIASACSIITEPFQL